MSSASTSEALLDLPVEILSLIIEKLPPKGFLPLRLVCKVLRDVTDRYLSQLVNLTSHELDEHSMHILGSMSRNEQLQEKMRTIIIEGPRDRKRRCRFCRWYAERPYVTCTNRIQAHAWCEKEADTAKHLILALSHLPKLHMLGISFAIPTAKAGLSRNEFHWHQASATLPNQQTRLFASVLRGAAAGKIKPTCIGARGIQLDHHAIDQRLPFDRDDVIQCVTMLYLEIDGFDTGPVSGPMCSSGHRGLSRLLARVPKLSKFLLKVHNVGSVRCGEQVHLAGEAPAVPFNQMHSMYEFRVMDNLSHNVSLQNLQQLTLTDSTVNTALLIRLLHTSGPRLVSLSLEDLKIVGSISGQPVTITQLVELFVTIAQVCVVLKELILQDLMMMDWDMLLTFQKGKASPEQLLSLHSHGTVQPRFSSLNPTPEGASQELSCKGRDKVVAALTSLCSQT